MSSSLQPHGLCPRGSSVLHYIPEFAQIHVHWADASIFAFRRNAFKRKPLNRHYIYCPWQLLLWGFHTFYYCTWAPALGRRKGGREGENQWVFVFWPSPRMLCVFILGRGSLLRWLVPSSIHVGWRKEVRKAWWLEGCHEVSDLSLVIGATSLDCFQDQTLAASYSLNFPLSSEN